MSVESVFNFKLPIDIRFSDFDSLGHVNNAIFFTYLEEARVKYFEKVIRPGEEVDWFREGIILAKAIIDYRKPIDSFRDYFISIRCSAIGNKSFTFEYVITYEANPSQAIVAEASTIMVCYDYETRTTIPVHRDWIQKIEAFEKRALKK